MVAAVLAESVAGDAKIVVKKFSVHYGAYTALSGVNLAVARNEIFSIIGPANAGKTSFLRVLNRMDALTSGMRYEGTVRFDGHDIRKWRNLYALRRRIGVVFPLPVGLPLSVFDNVAMAPRLRGVRHRDELEEIVERCLRRAALWGEVKDRLTALGSLLSGGQQQRLTIARALSQDPELLLLDEFSIAIDPVTTMKIEDVLLELKKEMTIIMVTNLVQQARRISDRMAFFHKGRCVEVGETAAMFDGDVRDEQTLDYLRGRFG